jgi:fibronectin type 3 domain-containing protein/predicted small lipoprotein YifL
VTLPRRAVLAVLLVPLALAACGRKGPPVAPERRLPAAVADLSATVASEGVRLTWTLPRLRVDRSPVKELRRVEVYRRPETGEAAAPSRPAILTFGGLFGPPTELPGFDRVANIVLAEPPKELAVEIAGSQVRFTDAQGLTFGQRYTYVVVAVDVQGRPSPPSNRVAVAVTAPPKSPVALAAAAGDREVRLTWTAPDALEDGSTATGELVYNVFRATAPDARPVRPINVEPILTPSYVDLGVQNDATYYYSVRAQQGAAGPASRPTAAVAATPEDQTPPAQPRGLVAVLAGITVRLAWEGVSDPDLAGYRVYRSTTAGRGHQPVTTELQASTTFVDTTTRPGQTYYYVVTAVDRARRANESVPSPEVSVTLP